MVASERKDTKYSKLISDRTSECPRFPIAPFVIKAFEGATRLRLKGDRQLYGIKRLSGAMISANRGWPS